MRFLQKIKRRFSIWRKKYLDFSPLTYKLIWGVLFFILISLTLSLDLIPNQVDLEAGQVSQTDITAPRTMTFIDEERTTELRNRAAENAPRVYEEDSIVESEINNKIKLLFTSIIEEREAVLENKLEESGTDAEESVNLSEQDEEAESSNSSLSVEEENLQMYELSSLEEEDMN
jgi:hypothetical protein